jgi:hypothetical protein
MIYYEDLVHTTMEAKTSHDVQAGDPGRLVVWLEDLRVRDQCNCEVLGADCGQCLRSGGQAVRQRTLY